MSDMGDDFRAMREASKEKRAANRDYGAKYLSSQGVCFTSNNSGAHLIVTHNEKVVDYWPGTGKFQVRGGKYGRGILNLMRALQQRSATSSPEGGKHV